MGVVNFSRIQMLYPPDALPINNATNALGPLVNIDGRPTLYNPLWGYFVFGQSIGFEYDEANAYQDKATFTLRGSFTHNAENVTNESDEVAFTALVAKYDALEKAFKDAAVAEAPADYQDWGTDRDPRCIVLPNPLVDKDGNKVVALPINLTIEKTQFPIEIRYQATLQEAKFPIAKLVVNDFILDSGNVVIQMARPNFNRHELPGCNGEILQIQHYYPMEVAVSGSIPLNEENILVSDMAKELAGSLAGGLLTLSLATRNGNRVDVDTIFDEDLSIVDQPAVESDPSAASISVDVQARE